MNNNRQIAKNLFFNSSTFVINFIISFFFTPYLIRTVGKEAYSFFPLVNNIIGYSSILTTAVGSMAGRFITMHFYKDDMEGANEYLNSMWVANLLLSILFTILSIFCVVYIDKILTVPAYLLSDVRWLFGLGLFSLVLGLLTGYYGLATYVRNRVDLESSRGLICNFVRIGLIFLLFWLFKPSIVYMSLSAVVSGIVLLLFNYNFKKRLLPELTISPRKYFSWEKVVELTSSGVWNSVNQLSNMLLYQLDLLITNIFISAAATGDYAIAKTAPSLILSLLSMLSGTFVALFNILYAKGQMDQVVKEIRKSMVVVGMLIGLPIGFLCVFSDVFYALWVPGQDAEMLKWMTIITILPMICGGSINPIFGIFSVTNKLKIPSLVVLGAGLLQTLVIFILLKTTNLGIWAIVITSAIQGLLRNSLFSPSYGAICLGKRWTTFYPTMFRGIAGVLVVIALGLFYRQVFVVDSWITFLFAGCVVCALSLCINSLVMLKRTEREYLFATVKNKIPWLRRK